MLISVGANATRDHYISTTLLAVFLFLYYMVFISNISNRVSKIGMRDSTWMYIIHPFFIMLFDALLGRINIPMYLYVRPLLVFGTSTFFTELAMKVKKDYFGKA